jgi:Mce-associated membrane protein
VTDPAAHAGPRPTSWRTVNLVLILVVLALAAGSVVWFSQGASATPGQSRAETLSRQYEAVTKSARAETEAFLTVDYKNMDPLIDKVIAGAAGSFKEQYSQAKVTLKASAQDAQAMSTGKVLSVGVGDIDDSDAIVFVAADSQVSNKSTKGKAQPRYYRFRLTMVRQGGQWRTSDLQFVN